MTDLKARMQSDLNKMYDHLIEQGGKALRPNGVSCAYRGAGGTKCAVGCLIPDEMYDEAMEDSGAYPVVRKWGLFDIPEGSWGFDKYVQFLSCAQLHMHDGIDLRDWGSAVLEGYEYIADTFNLKVERGNG